MSGAKVLVVYCHPFEESFTAAVRDRVVKSLTDCEAETRQRDLYKEEFQPVLTREEWLTHTDEPANAEKVAEDVMNLRWCDTIIFIYPTWWYGVPAMLKGWLDRVLVSGVAYHMPSERQANLQPGLTNVRRLAVFTTCGATRWLSMLIGQPGKKLFLRGVRVICARRTRARYVALYDMNHATFQQRTAHLDKVEREVRRLVRGRP